MLEFKILEELQPDTKILEISRIVLKRQSLKKFTIYWNKWIFNISLWKVFLCKQIPIFNQYSLTKFIKLKGD